MARPRPLRRPTSVSPAPAAAPRDAAAPAAPVTASRWTPGPPDDRSRTWPWPRRRALGGAPGVAPRDVHEHVRAGREGNLVVFCVDASGSMGARRRMAAVKGALLGMLLDAYRRRDKVALVTFGGAGADVALPPTSSVERAAAALERLPTGGGTPLSSGIRRAEALVAAETRRDPDRRSLVLVVTDGRASGGRPARAEAARAAAALARTAAGVVVFDAEEGPVRLGLAGELANAAGAALLPLSHLHHPAPRRAA
jgi:magnesium chelatase subunit D